MVFTNSNAQWTIALSSLRPRDALHVAVLYGLSTSVHEALSDKSYVTRSSMDRELLVSTLHELEDSKDFSYFRPQTAAAAKGNYLTMLKVLLDAGLDPDAKDGHASSAWTYFLKEKDHYTGAAFQESIRYVHRRRRQNRSTCITYPDHSRYLTNRRAIRRNKGEKVTAKTTPPIVKWCQQVFDIITVGPGATAVDQIESSQT